VNHGKKGTARRSFQKMSYQTAGKSGTAQVFGLKEDEEYNADEIAEHLRDHALFTGYAPFEDPEAVVTIVLENAGGGSSNGGPVVRKILDHIILAEEDESKAT
ncbi:penicillin-binding transpeptidase domain-containing protein, partial [Vibrio sp. 10N.261.49.A5]